MNPNVLAFMLCVTNANIWIASSWPWPKFLIAGVWVGLAFVALIKAEKGLTNAA